jgi:hypothetical protein
MAVIPIIGLLGLAYLAMKNTEEEETYVPSSALYNEFTQNDDRGRLVDTLNGSMYPDESRGQVLESNPFHVIARDRYPAGLPSYLNSQSQQYVSGVMDNVGPVSREQVGPGLGVGPTVPAYGGYQQLFRVKPTNVGEYKLTTLPGRSGPAADVTGGRQGFIGELNHKMPAKTAYLPSRLPPTAGRGQGQGGAATAMTEYGIFEKSKRTTTRAETSHRGDGLGFGGAKKLVGAATLAQDPTRNKGDCNAFQLNHVNNPKPGVTNFFSGHFLAPENQLMGGRIVSPEEYQMYGMRQSDNRSNPDRAGNAGRMNVRANPLAQGGSLSSVRMDTNKYDGRFNPVNGGYTQNYTNTQMSEFNSYKGQENPRASSQFLSTAVNQLKNNPLVVQ